VTQGSPYACGTFPDSTKRGREDLAEPSKRHRFGHVVKGSISERAQDEGLVDVGRDHNHRQIRLDVFEPRRVSTPSSDPGMAMSSRTASGGGSERTAAMPATPVLAATVA